MKRSNTLSLIVFLGLAIAACFSALAEGVSKETIAACSREYASSKLDPLRGKLDVSWGESVTDDMRANQRKPTPSERVALAAYLDALAACHRYQSIERFPTDFRKQKESEEQLKNWQFQDLGDLKAGKISYAEYFRRQDKKLEDFKQSFNEAQSKRQYQTEMENWLDAGKSKYGNFKPFWSFYEFAIETSKKVDQKLIPKETGEKAIEERRLQFNKEWAEENAPKPVLLNCSFDGTNGFHMDRPMNIDFAKNQVNGYSAQISESEIRVRLPSKNGDDVLLTINRLSGYGTMGSEKFPMLVSGYCRPASKQF